MNHMIKRWLTLSFMGLILFTESSMAFWFCSPMSSGQSENNASSIARPSYPMGFKEMAITTKPPHHTVGFNESKSPMPSPLERSRPGWMEPPMPYPAYPMRPASGIRLEKGSDADNYYLTIHLTGYQPEDIGVTAGRGGLMIYNIRSEEHRHSAEGYYQHMTSFRRFSRRISLPPDADSVAMTRTNGDNKVEVVVPRMR